MLTATIAQRALHQNPLHHYFGEATDIQRQGTQSRINSVLTENSYRRVHTDDGIIYQYTLLDHETGLYYYPEISK